MLLPHSSILFHSHPWKLHGQAYCLCERSCFIFLPSPSFLPISVVSNFSALCKILYERRIRNWQLANTELAGYARKKDEVQRIIKNQPLGVRRCSLYRQKAQKFSFYHRFLNKVLMNNLLDAMVSLWGTHQFILMAIKKNKSQTQELDANKGDKIEVWGCHIAATGEKKGLFWDLTRRSRWRRAEKKLTKIGNRLVFHLHKAHTLESERKLSSQSRMSQEDFVRRKKRRW